MASSIVGNLIVRLAADIGSYESGMRKADKESKRRLRDIERRVQTFERNFKRSMGAAAAGVSLVSGAMAVMVAKQSQAFKETDSVARAIDVQTGRLQELQYAAQRVGIDHDKMADILKDTSEKIGDAYANGGGEAKEVLDNLGLSAAKLVQMSPDDQLLAIADAMQGMPRASQINVLESMGNDASRLIPLLENGAQKLHDFSQEARDLNVSMDDREIEQMREANKAIDDLRGTYDGLANRITIAATPAIRDFADTLMDEDVQRGLENMASAIVTIIDKLSQAVSWFSRFGEAIGTTFGKMAAGAADPIERLRDDIAGLQSELDGLSNNDVFGQLGAAGVPGANTGPATGAEADRIRAQIRAKQQQLDQLQAMQRAAEQAANNIDVSALFNDAGIGMNAAFPIPDMPETPKGGWKPKVKPRTAAKSGAESRIESLQKELALYGDLNHLEEARISLANGYYGKVSDAQAESILQYSRELDMKDSLAEETRAMALAEDKRKSAVESVTNALATQREQAFAAFQERQAQIEQITDDESKQAELRRRNWERLTKDLADGTDTLSIFAQRASENIQDEFGNTLQQALAGNFDNIKDNWAGMLRNMAAQAAAARLNSYLFGGEGANSGGGLLGKAAGWLGAAAGAWFGGGAGATNVAGSIGGDAPLSLGALSGIPGRATGGPTSAGGLYEVNERGEPEMLSAGGRSYLLMGQQSGHVSPVVDSAPAAMSSDAAGRGGDVVVNITNNGQPMQEQSRRTRRGPGGEQIVDIQVKSAMARMASSGELDEVLAPFAKRQTQI